MTDRHHSKYLELSVDVKRLFSHLKNILKPNSWNLTFNSLTLNVSWFKQLSSNVIKNYKMHWYSWFSVNNYSTAESSSYYHPVLKCAIQD